MKTTLKITAAILAAWAVIGPAEAGRWSRDRVVTQSPAAKAAAAPAIPGLPDATPQYRQEFARVNAMLARNPNAFGGFTPANTLAELRAQVDRNIHARHARELANRRLTEAQRTQLMASHVAFWDGLAARRELRNQFTDEQNIVHSLMMILKTSGKLKGN
jgi:hypothetical protein